MPGPAFPGAMNTGPMLGAHAARPGSVSSRARSSDNSIPIMMWCAGGAAVLLVVATLMFMVGRGSSPDPKIAQTDAQPAASQDVQPPTPPSTPSLTQLQQAATSADPAVMGEPAPTTTPPAGTVPVSTSGSRPVPPRIESPEDIYKLAKCSVVKIDVFSNTFNPRSGLGSGFIIDTQRRLVATNYHVVSTAAKADIVFDDGTRFGIEGYVLVEPEMDLAVLKANGLPSYAQALQLASDADPNPGSQVYSIGHPNDYKLTMRSGLISSVANTSELPEDAQMFLRGEGTSRSDNRWIQHEAEIFGGNSGGPLLDKHGVVLGINTWKDESINGHFALHCKALSQLLKRPMDRVEPLTKYQQRDTPPADRLARMIDVNALRSLFTRLELNDWTPQNAEDYDSFGILGLALTVLEMAEFDPEDPRAQAWRAQVSEFLDKMQKVDWLSDQSRVDKINGYAEAALEEPTRGQGVFFIMDVQTGAIGPNFYLMHGVVGKTRVVVRLLDPTFRPGPAMGKYLVPGVVVGGDVVNNQPAPVILSARPIFLAGRGQPPRRPPVTAPPKRTPPPRLSPPKPPTSP